MWSFERDSTVVARLRGPPSILRNVWQRPCLHRDNCTQRVRAGRLGSPRVCTFQCYISGQVDRSVASAFLELGSPTFPEKRPSCRPDHSESAPDATLSTPPSECMLAALIARPQPGVRARQIPRSPVLSRVRRALHCNRVPDAMILRRIAPVRLRPLTAVHSTPAS